MKLVEILITVATIALGLIVVLAEVFGPKFLDDKDRYYQTQSALDTYNSVDADIKGDFKFQLCISAETEEGKIDIEDVFECVSDLED